MRTKEETKQFILKTLLPYKEDANNCAYMEGRCKYLTEDGKKCAIGQHMKEGEWQDFEGDVRNLLIEYNRSHIFTEEFLSHDLDLELMVNMQQYHDYTTDKPAKKHIDNVVKMIELKLGIDLDELKWNVSRETISAIKTNGYEDN